MTDKLPKPILLPKPIAAYFATGNARDFEALANCFSADATVHDERADHAGRSAISAWAANAHARYLHTSEAVGYRDMDGVHMVSVRVSGRFPASPVTLTHRFQLADDQIRSLEIG